MGVTLHLKNTSIIIVICESDRQLAGEVRGGREGRQAGRSSREGEVTRWEVTAGWAGGYESWPQLGPGKRGRVPGRGVKATAVMIAVCRRNSGL